MITKVREMLNLVEYTEPVVHIVSGLIPGLLGDVLKRDDVPEGTRIMLG
jgi:hypothetical protein